MNRVVAVRREVGGSKYRRPTRSTRHVKEKLSDTIKVAAARPIIAGAYLLDTDLHHLDTRAGIALCTADLSTRRAAPGIPETCIVATAVRREVNRGGRRCRILHPHYEAVITSVCVSISGITTHRGITYREGRT